MFKFLSKIILITLNVRFIKVHLIEYACFVTELINVIIINTMIIYKFFINSYNHIKI